MDKNKIKVFAVWARRNLISSVSERANRIGVTENKIQDAIAVQGGFKLEGNDEIFKLSKNDRDALVSQIREKDFEQVMEEVAYTWFNRFMALRYMEVNKYIPSGIRVLSSEVEGKVEPDVLTRVSEVIDELGLNAEYIYNLLDSGKTEDREEAYKNILVRQCNELGKIIPEMFEKISDYTELLLPDNLLEEGSVIRKMVEDIEEEDWKEEVEIIGWMYQYYISEKKDEVFAALKKNVKITKENIPAATQLFTPKWIVKYMVENSLGRLWLEGHPNEKLQKQWKYYLEEAEQEPEVEEELKKIREEHSKLKPEDIKVLDPCMGSGHILVYAFDVLYEIYKTAGYSEREIPRLILQNNLYGLDIDDRAAQLASFALIMKARHYNRRLFREIEREYLELNLCSIQESNGLSKEVINYFVGENEELRSDVEYLVETFTDAKEYGSILEVEEVDFDGIKTRLIEILDLNDNIAVDNNGIPVQIDTFSYQYKNIILDKLPIIIKQAEIMSRKYEVCITNPPYMGYQGMNNKLLTYLKKVYPNSKSDLFAVFMEYKNIKTNGYLAMINQQSWMFLSSFEELRKSIIKSKIINSMLHLGTRTFDEIGGEVVQSTAFIMQKTFINYKGMYIKLTEYKNSVEKENNYLYALNNREIIFKVNMKLFADINGGTIAYWLSNRFFEIFKDSVPLRDIAEPRKGLATGDNDRFIRKWYELDNCKIAYCVKRYEDAKVSDFKWFLYNKGGEYRKWYGNNEHVLNWKNDGYEIKNFKDENGKLRSRPQNVQYYFKRAITWSKISSNNFGVRYSEGGYAFDDAGSSVFPTDELIYFFTGLLCSKLSTILMQALNPTLNFQVGNVSAMPIILCNNKNEDIDIIVKENINLAKNDWNHYEISFNFKVHPLLKLLDKGEQYKLEAVFSIWKTECGENFEQLKQNEEELNRIFIDIYGLQDELTPEVEDKDITIRKADRERDIKSFISYAVGCMLGRYSIDAEGLIYAGGDFKDKWDLEDKKVRKIEKDDDGNVISDSWVDATFLPDKDNVIPITEDEYFEDDIVSRFIDFVRTVYGEETLEENLDFIADSISRKASETSRQAIRRYFIKDFYKDHLKVYQKRPIYWMFDSGKNNGFKALIYMHRYNEQTVAKVRTDYLHTLQRKYEAEIQRQQLIVDSEEYSAKDRTAAKKKIVKIAKQIEECREYDQVVAHLANEKISIDLDDGVKVNYAKFQGVKVINSKEKEVKMDLLAKI
ncbi:class I SAM-dependent DNA methyltransferase [Clostridium tetani]|uniref:BREX-1 system adenine-specific DNA-methyltransferase PglX n=1 Tax=Clostridium tetani TaxID=1513 RepID=UPI00100AB453|nr:BREX-1 system adenine-specific DNA-methyltransferase PglX [Clostridium tetani]RXM67784.1 BREX-1 system adenine-specific DNA-methyltransferase PglX [Clostridium tetani]BDR69749.1 class I SAM-dependent DNA methyltransferase [Clostridium tetani]BDR72507.1 class I SAM-dependent DNA methyltransferase [Clostridium tetani]BDR75552.1 class I SAM-dependent DNA methyltransferase [Clostridium tetani]BEV19385.1 BREX-1 system adenine-specific DNA-methyltransferase PglX [Clostridium tetani]